MSEKQYVLVAGKRIQEITPLGLTYLNDQGEKQIIDFSICNQNQIAEFKKWNTKTDEELAAFVESMKNHRVVAFRNAPALWIQFHTTPPIRFEFSTPDEFEQFRRTLHKLSWRTEDVT